MEGEEGYLEGLVRLWEVEEHHRTSATPCSHGLQSLARQVTGWSGKMGRVCQGQSMRPWYCVWCGQGGWSLESLCSYGLEGELSG